MPTRKAKSSTPKATATPKDSTPVAPVKASASTAAPARPVATPTTEPASIDANVKKAKLVRDSFTLPKDEHAAIQGLKLRAAQQSHLVKKSELLRAGLKILAGLNDKEFIAALQAVTPIKAGRPAKAEKAPTSTQNPAQDAAEKPSKTTKAS